MASGSSSTVLSASNSRLRLSLSPPTKPATSFHPGDMLRPSVTISGHPDYTSLSLRLLGKTKATIYGKDRWQAGAQMQLGMGGSPMPVTSTENLTFLDVEIPLVSSAGARKVAEQAEKGKEHDDREAGAEGGVYEVILPPAPEGQLLPTFKKLAEDASGVEVTYSLELHGVRKGVFKTNDKLSIELPVSIPLSPAPSPSPPLSAWPSATGTPNSLASELTLSYLPLRTASSILNFHLSLGLVPTSPEPTILPSLSRRIHTAPLQDPDSGQPFDWAGIRVAKGNVLPGRGGAGTYEGTVQIPESERTVQSRGVAVHYVLTCQVTSPGLEKSLLVSFPVFLPSSEIAGDEAAADAGGGGDALGEFPPPYEG